MPKGILSFVMERTHDLKDRRVVLVKMTKNRRTILPNRHGLYKKRIAQLTEKFSSEEQDQLLRLMSKLLNKLQEEK